MTARTIITGHWELNASYINGAEIEDMDREHIAAMIIEGYTSGQLVREIDEEDAADETNSNPTII